MSTQRKPEFVEEPLSEQAVHDYLEANPDFFERHGALLRQLELPHGSGGAVSLVERQVAILRQKELKLQRQLKDLIDVARDNDVLAAKIHQLCLQLLAAADLQGCVSAVEEAMRAGFGADHSILVLFADPDMFNDIEGRRFFRVVQRDDKALGPFDTFLNGKGPRCGQVRDAQIEFLFRLLVNPPVDNPLASVQCLAYRNVSALLAGIRLRYGKRLCKEILQFSGPFIDYAVRGRQLIDPYNQYDAAQVFIPLEHLDDRLGDIHMPFSYDVDIEVGARRQ